MSYPRYQLKELADLLQAQFVGDAECVVNAIAPLQKAVRGQLSFLDNPRYQKFLANTQASIVILSPSFLPQCQTNALVVENPYHAYATVADLFAQKPEAIPGVHPTAVVESGCEIDPSASIGPYVVIGTDCKIGPQTIIEAHCVVGSHTTIGAQCHLHPFVSIYQDCYLADRIIIHSGVVIGSDGFGFAKHKGQWRKVPQLGAVQIDSDVEIGANTAIDRGAMDDTVIGEDVKLDNQLQVAHNVQIGAHTAIAGCTAIAGSVTIGRDCLIGGSANINGHIQIADNVAITGTTGITKSITKPGVYSSYLTAREDRQWKRTLARLHQLDKMMARIKELEETVETLKEGNPSDNE